MGPASAPGAMPARTATDADNNAKLLAALAGLPPERRGPLATSASSRWPSPTPPAPAAACRSARSAGPAAGGSRPQARGNGGFGYDPIFEPIVRASGRPDAGLVDAGGEEPDLASRGGGPADDADPPRARVLTVPGLRRICVFCGASSGRDPRYADVAAAVGGDARPAWDRARLRRRPDRADGCASRTGRWPPAAG